MNLNVDLLTFNSIKPCGLDVEACNLQDYININELEFKESFIKKFEQKLRQ
jgi:lipoate-protein ligase B